MTRRKSRPLLDEKRLILLWPDSLTPDLLHRRWRVVSPNSAERRTADGSVDAWVRADALVDNGAGPLAVAWTGCYTRAPLRWLESPPFDGVRAMYAIEEGEAGGPLSEIWRGGAGRFATARAAGARGVALPLRSAVARCLVWPYARWAGADCGAVAW